MAFPAILEGAHEVEDCELGDLSRPPRQVAGWDPFPAGQGSAVTGPAMRSGAVYCPCGE